MTIKKLVKKLAKLEKEYEKKKEKAVLKRERIMKAYKSTKKELDKIKGE